MIVLSDFKEPDSIIRFQQNNTKAVMDQRELGTGILYITESLLSWQGPQGFSIPYQHISMHALSKDTNLYPTECLYLMIDKHVQLPGIENNEVNQNEDDDSDNESDNDVSELIFEPQDKTALAQMYEAIKQCQELHPDPVDVSTDEDEAFEDMIEDGYIEDMEAAGNDNQVENMQNLSLNDQQLNGFVNQQRQENHMDEEQFEDAD